MHHRRYALLNHLILVGTVCFPATSVTKAADEQPAMVAPGLSWVRFNSRAFSRPMTIGIAEHADIDTGTTFNDYSQIWLGLLHIPTDEPITFSAEADNGLRLLLNYISVIDGLPEDGVRRGQFHAEKGKRVPLRLEFIQNGGTAHLRLFWEWKGQARESIPENAFFHTSDQKKRVEGMRDGKRVDVDRSVIYQPDEGIPGRAMKSEWPIRAEAGPHLLIDDYLIARSNGVDRVIVQPQRDAEIANPIVTGPGDRCFQPFFTVLRNEETGRWRIWYEASRDDQVRTRSLLATMESADGIHFERPHRICNTSDIQFGSEVIDRGLAHPDPRTRYVYSYWLNGGTRLFSSPDGFNWDHLEQNRVLMHTNDIGGIDRDPIRNVYVATVSHNLAGANWTGTRRTTMMSISSDLSNWEKEWFALTANSRLDEGDTQFYAMDGYLTRGSLRIGMVKVLRDDLVAVGTQPGSRGRAHTSLAWSRDGRTWIRDREMYFEPDDDPNAWDHAHAWIDEQVINGDQVHLYYAGYKQGHKINRFKERQIGLVRIPLDRYVARRATPKTTGMLTTVPFLLTPSTQTLLLNGQADKGAIRVRIIDAASGSIIPGFDHSDCVAFGDDLVRHPFRWKQRQLSSLAGRTIQLEFEIKSADLFAFEFAK